MSNAFSHTNAFAANGLATASNSKILVMCFDRLDRDLTMARSAIERDDHFATNDALRHAQDLLGEVAAMLDVDAWEHAASLLAVYDYVLRLLATANILKADQLVAEAQHLLGEIGGAFRAAAAEAPRAAVSPSSGDDTTTPGISIQA